MKKVIAFSLAVGMMLMQGSAFAIDANLTGVGGGASVSGLNTNHAYVDTNKVDGSVGTTNWTKFNIGKGETVTNRFNAQNQQLLFRVIGDPTRINGTWNSAGVGRNTGKTTLINPAGVMVGNGASINLGSLNINTLDSITKKAGNVKLDAGADINVDNLNIDAATIYSAANLNGKSIKLSTLDGINYDVMPGVDAKNSKGDIHIANSAFKNPDGSLVIAAGNTVKMENVKIIGGSADISAKNGNVNIQAGKDASGKLDMNKRTRFDGAKVHISTDSGNIYLENLDNVNGSHLNVTSEKGLIESSNNVNSGKSIYTVFSKHGDINATDLHNDNSQYAAKTYTGKIDLTTVDNRNKGDMNAFTNTGEINITGLNNRGGSQLNVESIDHDNVTPGGYVKPAGSQINLANSQNDKDSTMKFHNDKGHINLSNVKNEGTLVFNAQDGNVNINNSDIKGTIKSSKANLFNFNRTSIDNSAKIEELDGSVAFYHVKSNGTVNLKNKNGNVQVTHSTFDKNLNVDSTGDVTIATTTAKEMNAKGRDVTIYDLNKDILVNNVEASRDALLEGSGIKFKTVRAGQDAEVRSYDNGAILTGSEGGDIYAGRRAEVRSGTQDIILNKVEGDTLHTTFNPDNKVRIHGGKKVVLETSANNAIGFERTIDDTANNRNFELRAGQFDYAPNTVALKTGVITLDGKRSDLNVRDGQSNDNTIDINAFESDNLNIKTQNGNIYVYEPITRPGMDYEAKKVGTAVYHIWPGGPGGDDTLQDLIDNQEINKIKDLNNDIAGLAPSPMIDFIPLGASAEIDEINKKYFIEVVKDDEYEVLQNLPIGTQDPSSKRREIY